MQMPHLPIKYPINQMDKNKNDCYFIYVILMHRQMKGDLTEEEQYPGKMLASTACATLLTSFGGRKLHLRRWMVAQPSSSLLAGVFLSCKVNARRSVHSPWYHFIITLSLTTDVTDMKLVASGPLDRSWWHCHTSLKFFCQQPMAPWTTGVENFL